MLKRKENKHLELNKPVIYLDSNIIRNALSSRNVDDIKFLENLRKGGYQCKTSIYTLLELFEVSKDRQFLIKMITLKFTEVNDFLRERTKRDLNHEELEIISQQINSLFLKYDFIEICNISTDAEWNAVKQICEKSNLHMSDIIHLITAYGNNCQYIATRDEFFIKEGSRILSDNNVKDINIVLPEKLF